MNINFSGYNENVVTFEVEGSDVTMGTPVKMASSNTVCACGIGDSMVGVAVNVRNGYAAVQLSGYIEMPTDDEFSVGYTKIASASENKVTQSENGREYLVVSVSDALVGFIL
ncbi:MAG: hypothetical protein IKB73_06850 [Ruminococcus sp.]|nr:hypothetical protein [Ruminococcus sp.]